MAKAAMKEWSDEWVRADGAMIVAKARIGFYEALRADGLRMDRCVCCLRAFETPEAARRVADYAWPLMRGATFT